MALPTTPTVLTSAADIWTGTLQDDWVQGGGGNDDLSGGAGNDKLEGGGGNDVLRGGLGNDLLYGGGGSDTLYGDEGDDTLHGGAGDDWLSAGVGNDTLYGGLGNDSLSGGDGIDRLSGGDGDDTLAGDAGNDVLKGGAGSDRLFGGDGIDTAVVSGVQASYLFQRQTDGSVLMTDTVGTDGTDLLYDIESLRFSDGTVRSLDSVAPLVTPTVGDDTIFGTTGNNAINALAGNDTVYGGNGNDTVNGGAGNDTLFGGDGLDTAVFDGNRADYVVTRLADGRFEVKDLRAVGGTGTDVLSGIESVKFADMTVDPSSIAILPPIFGTAGSDMIRGTEFNDAIDGLAGDDQISGGLGNDVLRGGDGNDMIDGGYGNDTITGGAGLDLLSGGYGDDTFLEVDLATATGADRIDGGDGFDTIYLQQGDGANGNALRGIERVVGSDANEQLIFDLAYTSTPVSGNTGMTIEARGGNDRVSGTAFADMILGGDGDDTLRGNDGNDRLDGGSGNDIVFGDAGDDRLTYTSGVDTLTGGMGRDTFDFTQAVNGPVSGLSSAAFITDFTKGEDKVDLAGRGLTFADLHIVNVGGKAGVVLGSAAGAPSIRFENLTTTDITADMFLL
jgi:Ca2+-binding RTX toxin-like protein